MGKRVFNLWSDITSFEQLRSSTKLAQKGIRLNRSALSFLVEIDSNIIELQQRLKDRTYQPAPYTEFMLLDPKPRRIQAADFVDRVVHHSLCKSLTPHFERSYLAHSFACQKGKGNHKAIQQAQRFSRRFSDGWFLKIDIKHCFETIDHAVLMQRISKRIGCVDTLWLTDKIISHGGIDGKGLPIGNLTSQHFANFYLDALDHYCIEHLGARGFIRYMDDVLLFAHDKDDLLEALGELTLWLPRELKLEIKHTATQIHPVHHGVPFLGFRIFPKCIRFDAKRKRRFIQRWKSIAKMDEIEQSQRYNGLVCWAEQANTRQLRRHLLENNWLQS